MNLKFLGDALDHWKGSIFRRLQHSCLLEDFAVEPMLSDAGSWSTSDWELYVDLLAVMLPQIVKHEHDLLSNRKEYLQETLKVKGDIFLDPDTGIKTSGGRMEQYILPQELRSLMDVSETRIIIVYQHIRAQRTHTRLQEIDKVLQNAGGKFHGYSYESSTVAMLFLSKGESRLNRIGKYFEQYLGSQATKRIYRWH